ncbi:O-antigen ligase family protein [Micromonospora arida]|uniref:O-antigen ligase family protein n=1 Tax=Micromonospora arida TaxID=2203715 RepID=UPI0034069C59
MDIMPRKAATAPTEGSDRRLGRYPWAAARIMAALAMAVVGVKSFFDIFGEKVAADTVDAGMVVTVIGALLMVGSFVAVIIAAKRFPTTLAPSLIAVLIIGLFSIIGLLAIPAREDFVQIFATADVREIFGPHVAPKSGVITQGAQLAVGFAPIALLAVMFFKPDWFTLERLRWVLLAVILGAVAHSVIAWLQVVGVVPYTYFFNLMSGRVGRASGGYFHPASLGRLLIFAVFILYAAGNRLRLSSLARYGIVALLAATAVVSTHRITILCVALVIVAFELRRLPELLRQISDLPFRTAVWGAAILLVLMVLAAIRWGAYLWDRALFLLTQVGSLNPTNDEFLHGRGQIWFRVVDVWQDAPWDVWLIGLGYEPWNTHADPLRIFVVWGLLGLALMSIIFINLWRVTKRAVAVESRWMLTVLYVLTIISALTQKPTSYSYFMWLFFLSLLLLVRFFPAKSAPVSVPDDASGDPR